MICQIVFALASLTHIIHFLHVHPSFPGQALFDAGSQRLSASFGQGDGILQQHRHGHGTYACPGVKGATKNLQWNPW